MDKENIKFACYLLDNITNKLPIDVDKNKLCKTVVIRKKRIPVPLEYFIYWMVSQLHEFNVIYFYLSPHIAIFVNIFSNNKLVFSASDRHNKVVYGKCEIQPLHNDCLIKWCQSVASRIELSYEFGAKKAGINEIISNQELRKCFNEFPKFCTKTYIQKHIKSLEDITTNINIELSELFRAKLNIYLDMDHMLNVRTKYVKNVDIEIKYDLTESQQIEFLSRKRYYEQQTKLIINKYLKFYSYTGRVAHYEPLYIFGKLTIFKINIILEFYCNEIYYKTFGYYETAINNIKNDEDLQRLASQLKVDVTDKSTISLTYKLNDMKISEIPPVLAL